MSILNLPAQTIAIAPLLAGLRLASSELGIAVSELFQTDIGDSQLRSFRKLFEHGQGEFALPEQILRLCASRNPREVNNFLSSGDLGVRCSSFPATPNSIGIAGILDIEDGWEGKDSPIETVVGQRRGLMLDSSEGVSFFTANGMSAPVARVRREKSFFPEGGIDELLRNPSLLPSHTIDIFMTEADNLRLTGPGLGEKLLELSGGLEEADKDRWDSLHIPHIYVENDVDLSWLERFQARDQNGNPVSMQFARQCNELLIDHDGFSLKSQTAMGLCSLGYSEYARPLQFTKPFWLWVVGGSENRVPLFASFLPPSTWRRKKPWTSALRKFRAFKRSLNA